MVDNINNISNESYFETKIKPSENAIAGSTSADEWAKAESLVKEYSNKINTLHTRKV